MCVLLFDIFNGIVLNQDPRTGDSGTLELGPLDLGLKTLVHETLTPEILEICHRLY